MVFLAHVCGGHDIDFAIAQRGFHLCPGWIWPPFYIHSQFAPDCFEVVDADAPVSAFKVDQIKGGQVVGHQPGHDFLAVAAQPGLIGLIERDGGPGRGGIGMRRLRRCLPALAQAGDKECHQQDGGTNQSGWLHILAVWFTDAVMYSRCFRGGGYFRKNLWHGATGCAATRLIDHPRLERVLQSWQIMHAFLFAVGGNLDSLESLCHEANG